MVGGIVIEVIVLTELVWVNTVERGKRQSGKCAVYVERNENSEKIKPGDSFWWQGANAMWTPFENRKKPEARGGVDYDIRIPKIGFSGVRKPVLQ